MAENVVRRQRDELLALHHAFLLERGADGVDHHGVGDVAVERVAVAILAAQRVRARAGREEHLLVALGDLHDGQRRGGRDFAEQQHRAVLLDHALRLGRGGRGIDRVFRHQVDLFAHDAAGCVDLLGRHLHAELGVAADRAEEAGQRHQMADLYACGLGAEDGRRSDRGRAGKGGAGLQQSTSAAAGHHWSPPEIRRDVLSFVPAYARRSPSRFPPMRQCERRSFIVVRYFRTRWLLSTPNASQPRSTGLARI